MKQDKHITPSITIIVPTLPGRKQHLQKAIESCGDLPVEVERDPHHTGAGPTRNRAIQRVKTAWCGFLDDDDSLLTDYYESFQQAASELPEPDVIIFRMRYPDGAILPRVPVIAWHNVGISFAAKTSLLRKHPFMKGENRFQQNEDYLALKTLEEAGAKIVFSPRVVYLVKPTKEAQALAGK